MNILSKLLRKGADKIDSVKERDKLRVWQERLEKSRSAYRGELAEMENREALYRGDRKIEANVNSGNAPVKHASYVRNIVAELIEAQVDSNIPQPKVTPRNPDDEGRAKLIEDFLRNELDRLPFERLNDMQERTAPIQGGSWFLCEWDNSGHTHTTVGELAVSLLHPKQVIPQAGVSDPKEMDYIIMRSSQTKKAVRRKYGVDVSAESESDPECRTVGSSAYGDGTAGNSDELVTLNTAYYRGDRGGIGRFSWVNDVVVEDLPDYQAHILRRCKKCGQTAAGSRCGFCGSSALEEYAEEEETLTENYTQADGGVIKAIAGYEPRTEIDPLTGETTRLLDPVPTRVPRYKPGVFPFVLRRNVSVFGQTLGDSDVDKIRDEQNMIKKLGTKIEEKLLKGGSYVTLPKGVNIRRDDSELKVIEIERPEQKTMIDVITVEANIVNDANYLESAYQSARQTIGVTDSFQGRKDPTATSGKAKEFAAAQTAGRLESKRVMKQAAYADLFELMFKFALAYADEPRPVSSKNVHGQTEYRTFDRREFLKQDAAGQWYWDDEFLFSCDTAAPLASNREAMWQETRMNLESGAFGDPTSLETLVLFWTKMELLHYPGASDTKTYLEEQLEQQRRAAQMGGVPQAAPPGGVVSGAGQAPPGQELSAIPGGGETGGQMPAMPYGFADYQGIPTGYGG